MMLVLHHFVELTRRAGESQHEMVHANIGTRWVFTTTV